MAGFASGVLGHPIEKYYPVGQATCCRPALLLRNGTQRALRRCSSPALCGPSTGGTGVSCAGDDLADVAATGRLAAGFGGLLRPPGELGLGHAIPTAPAHCCSVCLDAASPARAPACEALNGCSGHGACGFGGRACACDPGWGGPACADRAGARGGTVPAPVLAAVVGFASVLLLGLLARSASLAGALDSTRRQAAAAAATARRAELEAPLLPASSDDDAEWGGDEGDEAQAEEAQGGGPAAAAAAPHPARAAAATAAVEPAAAAGPVDSEQPGEAAAEQAALEGEDRAPELEPAQGGAAQGGRAEGDAPAPAKKPNYMRSAPDCQGAPQS